MNRLLTAILLLAVGCLGTVTPALGQATSGRLDIQIEFTPAQQRAFDAAVVRESQRLVREARQKKLTIPADEIRRMAQKAAVGKQPLGTVFDGLTPESKAWLRQFYDRYRPSNMPNFNQLLQRHRTMTIDEIRDFYRATDTIKSSQGKRQVSPAPLAVSPAVPISGAATPTHSDITGSKLIVKDYYYGQERNLISLPNQDLYFRGSYNPGTSPYFPDYPNIHCDNCCGPAAGQSLLEWFAVPVKKPDGTVLTSSADIQKRLANLMETEDGIDYTHPDELARTLMRDEYKGNKGWCYKDGGGSLAQVHYMLSAGTPVILLIAEDSWAHYITLYGYKRSTDEYFTSNDEDYSKSRLLGLWKFSNTSTAADVAYFLTNTHSRTLFSYSPDGCDKEWSYSVVHTDPNAYPGASRDDLYYYDFNEAQIDNLGESGRPLSFYGYYRMSSGTAPLPVTDVGSAKENIYLSLNNSKVVRYPNPYGDAITDLSAGQQIDVLVRLDRQFMDKYAELHCGFAVSDENGNAVLSNYGLCSSLTTASSLNSGLYDVAYSPSYQPNHKRIDFVLHGGLRRQTWDLAGCNLDTDGDAICNSVDSDDDNDGVEDDADNCPLTANANQTDNNGNGEGLACDNKEQCLIGCDPNYFTDSRNSICAYHCYGRQEQAFELDPQWDRLFASKWWGVIKDLGRPGISDRDITRNPAFKATVKEYRAIRKNEGVILSRRQAEKEWLRFVRDMNRTGRTPVREP
jgi:hypothetical protein